MFSKIWPTFGPMRQRNGVAPACTGIAYCMEPDTPTTRLRLIEVSLPHVQREENCILLLFSLFGNITGARGDGPGSGISAHCRSKRCYRTRRNWLVGQVNCGVVICESNLFFFPRILHQRCGKSNIVCDVRIFHLP